MGLNIESIKRLLTRINSDSNRQSARESTIAFLTEDVPAIVSAANELIDRVAELEEELAADESVLTEMQESDSRVHTAIWELLEYLREPIRMPTIGSDLWILLDKLEQADEDLHHY